MLLNKKMYDVYSANVLVHPQLSLMWSQTGSHDPQTRVPDGLSKAMQCSGLDYE